MRFDCRRDIFTPEELEESLERFWAMPVEWGDLKSPKLAEFWKKGKAGLISALPILGQFANLNMADRLFFSIEEMARLGGVDPATVSGAKQALAWFGLVSSELATWELGWDLGGQITKWNLSQSFLALKNQDGRFNPDSYFRFNAPLIYGGNWACLTPPQQLIYLAIGCSASTYHCPDQFFWVKRHLDARASLEDINRCWNQFDHVRVARLSYGRIRRITGLSLSSIKNAVAGFKHPALWAKARIHEQQLKFCPISVYPTTGGPLVYHLRDHVPHWPWDKLNTKQTSNPIASAETGGR